MWVADVILALLATGAIWFLYQFVSWLFTKWNERFIPQQAIKENDEERVMDVTNELLASAVFVLHRNKTWARMRCVKLKDCMLLTFVVPGEDVPKLKVSDTEYLVETSLLPKLLSEVAGKSLEQTQEQRKTPKSDQDFFIRIKDVPTR